MINTVAASKVARLYGVTMYNPEFHKSNDKYDYERIISKRLEDHTITSKDAELIRCHIIDKLSNGHIVGHTASKISSQLCQYRRYSDVEYKDFTLQAFKVASLKLRGFNDLSESTKRGYIKAVKNFIPFLEDNGIIKPISERELKKLKPPREVKDKVKPSDILSQSEIDQLVAVCDNSRDRAIIWLMYETGARVGEIARLTWEDITFFDGNARVRIEDENCHGERYPYVVQSIPYIRQHQLDSGMPEKSEFVFKNRGTNIPVTYRAIAKLIAETLPKRAGFKKKVYCHLLRHSRITNMIKEGYQESIIKKMMWQTVTTQMFEHYLKLAEADIQNEVTKKNGVTLAKVEAPKVPKIVKCPYCSDIHNEKMLFCPSTGHPLKDGLISFHDEISEADRELLKLLKNPKIVEKLQKLADE